MKIIGITGTFGSGKSEAARILTNLGAYLVDHDKINNEILQRGHEGYLALIKEYGIEVLDKTGEIDRKRVANIAFSSKESVKKIERILHPIIIKTEEELVKKYKKEREYDYIVFDTPLLFEAGRDAVCDYTVVVTAEEEILYERIKNKFGLNKEDANKRISLQLPLKEKASRADFIIENNGSLQELEEKIKRLLDKIKEKEGTNN